MNATRKASLAIVAGAVCATVACSHEKSGAQAAPPPPPTVYVTKVERRDLPLYSETVAVLDGYVNADIRARVRGYLREQKYKDGSPVKRDQLLFTIEPDEYQTAIAGAKASLSRAKVAQQRGAVIYDRAKGLYQTGLVSQLDLVNAHAGAADADSQIEAAGAQLKEAELNLSYTQIHSPIAGVAGLALVRTGNLVGQDGPTLLTTVSQVDPMRVTFPISEVDYVREGKSFTHLEQRDLAWAKQQFAKMEAPGDAGEYGVELVLSDGSLYPKHGVIVSANRQVDASTGTISLQALFPNADGVLRPGQYGQVRMRRKDEGHDVLVVPDKALISVQGTYSVAVVAGDKAHLHTVEVGPSVDGLRLIKSGIEAGDMVVVEGVQKVSDGAPVHAEPAPPEKPNAGSK